MIIRILKTIIKLPLYLLILLLEIVKYAFLFICLIAKAFLAILSGGRAGV